MDKDNPGENEDNRLGKPLRRRLDSGIDQTILEGGFNMETCVSNAMPFMLGQQLGPIGQDNYCVVEFLCGGDQALCDAITKTLNTVVTEAIEAAKKNDEA